MPKTRLNINLDQDLADFAKIFATENRTSVADIITQYLLSLKRCAEGESTEKILAHPAFEKALEDAQRKLRSGTAEWHSYAEVFGECSPARCAGKKVMTPWLPTPTVRIPLTRRSNLSCSAPR